MIVSEAKIYYFSTKDDDDDTDDEDADVDEVTSRFEGPDFSDVAIDSLFERRDFAAKDIRLIWRLA